MWPVRGKWLQLLPQLDLLLVQVLTLLLLSILRGRSVHGEVPVPGPQQQAGGGGVL